MTDLIAAVQHVEHLMSTPSPRRAALSVAVYLANTFIDEALREAGGGRKLTIETIVELDAALHKISEEGDEL